MSRKLSSMYGATLKGSTIKRGDVLQLSLTASVIANRYALEGEDLLSELTEAHKTDLRYALLLLRCVLCKLAALAEGRQTALPTYVQRGILYILEHFQKGVTLEETARHLGLSGAYFSDIFAQQMGQSFKNYLDGIRFSYAKNLLAFTDVPIGEVFARAGFSDYANFARRFKAAFGMTPTAYRAQNTEKE